MKTLTRIAAAAGLLLSLSAAAFAQTAPPAGQADADDGEKTGDVVNDDAPQGRLRQGDHVS